MNTLLTRANGVSSQAMSMLIILSALSTAIVCMLCRADHDSKTIVFAIAQNMVTGAFALMNSTANKTVTGNDGNVRQVVETPETPKV